MNETLLQIKDVCLSYGERHILCHINQSIKKNDFIVLTGPNGGGKTTLLRLVAGLIQPARGRINRTERLIVGYLPQYRQIDRQFPTTVHDIVLSGLQCRKHIWQRFTAEHHEQTNRMLAYFNLEELQNRPISDLSGGQWQRTLLARAFVSEPDLLLLDEPETHMDEDSRNKLYHLLTERKNNRAFVIVSHEEHLFPTFEGRKLWHVENQQVIEQSTW